MLNTMNFHITDNCNYDCKHCFVKKEKHQLSIENAFSIIDNIERYFLKNKIENGRINLAGGEPLTVIYLQKIIDRIVQKKIEVSLITNGSLLTEKFISDNAEKIAMIGISVDSLQSDTNKIIGRCDKSGSSIPYEKLVAICTYIKSAKIKLKINICISKNNVNENFLDFLTEINPDRLKLLQMTIIDKGVNDASMDDTISEDAFNDYCKMYKKFNPVIEPSSKIKNSYLIIDSKGNVGTDNTHRTFQYNLLNKELIDVIDKIDFNEDFYNDKYT